MKNRLLVIAGIATVMFLGSAIGGAIVASRNAEASRNSAGTYALANPPVTTLQSISSTLWNSTFSDLATGVTDSLDRNGRGGMLAALRGVDGTVAAPAFSWTSETGSGLYRIGAGNPALAVLGSKRQEWTTTGSTVTGTLTSTGALSSGGTLSAADLISNSKSGTASSVLGQFLEPSLSDGNLVQSCTGFGTSSNQCATLTYNKNATVANSTACLGLAGSASTLCVDGTAKTYIGSGGSGVTALYRGSVSWTPGSVAANTCASTNVTVTGASVGDECFVGAPGITGAEALTCTVNLSNTCVVQACNATTGASTFTSGTYRCTVIH